MPDVQLLESKMTEIEQARSWSPRVIPKFEALIRSGDDLSLCVRNAMWNCVQIGTSAQGVDYRTVVVP